MFRAQPSCTQIRPAKCQDRRDQHEGQKRSKEQLLCHEEALRRAAFRCVVRAVLRTLPCICFVVIVSHQRVPSCKSQQAVPSPSHHALSCPVLSPLACQAIQLALPQIAQSPIPPNSIARRWPQVKVRPGPAQPRPSRQPITIRPTASIHHPLVVTHQSATVNCNCNCNCAAVVASAVATATGNRQTEQGAAAVQTTQECSKQGSRGERKKKKGQRI
ncbi:hypothetical protein HDV57DRAFT_58170 [Trichoderma longibrachiatum]